MRVPYHTLKNKKDNTMKKLLLTFILTTSVFMYSFAQNTYEIAESIDFYRINKTLNERREQIQNVNDIKGSPYLNDEFINGTIYTTSNYQYPNIPLRYNIYSDNLEFKTPTDEIYQLSAPEVIVKAEFGGIKMEYIPFIYFKKMKRGFFQVKEEGKASLYIRSHIQLQQPTKPGAYKEAQPAKFLKKTHEFYIRFGKNAALKVGKKKETVAIFPKFQKEIEDFIKKNKINTNKEADLKKLVRHYNSL